MKNITWKSITWKSITWKKFINAIKCRKKRAEITSEENIEDENAIITEISTRVARNSVKDAIRLAILTINFQMFPYIISNISNDVNIIYEIDENEM